MEFNETIVKENPGLCRCCLSEGCYKDMGGKHTWMDETEVYADMLLKCFDIVISQHNNGPNGPNRLICEDCIARLRDACNFKKQVLDSEKKFIDMIDRGEFKQNVVIDPSQFKTEAEDSVNEEYFNDNDMDFSDDEPLNTLKEPRVSNITVTTLQVKNKRGKPKKTAMKSENAKLEKKAKSKSLAEEEDKPLVSVKQTLNDAKLLRDLADLRRLLTAVIEHSTIMPFRWCSNKYMCFYCRCPFSSSTTLKQHTLNEHENPKLKYILQTVRTTSKIKLDVSEIICKKCSKSLENLSEFFDHLNAIHDMKLNKDVTVYMFAYKLSDDGMSCLDCGQKFRFFGTLIGHVHKLHTKTEMFLCEICGQGFSGRANVMNHVRTVHNVNNRCNKCYRSYSSDAALADHVRRVHRQERLKCPKCPEILHTRYIRKRHMALVHDVKQYQFSCDLCPKTFMCLSVLTQHKARMHVKEKNFACEICGFKVFSKDLLKKHMVKHDDSRPFQCEICKKAFQRKKTLDLHIRIHTNDKRYVCKVCGKAFIQVTSLKLHGKVHHSVPDVSWS